MGSDGNGMVCEVVKSDGLGSERIERYSDARSVTLPSTTGMVRVDDVEELLGDHDDVPQYAIHEVLQKIEADPSTGGHVAIRSPGSSSHTALFERIDIYARHVHDALGSAFCGPDETWLRVVVPRELQERIWEAIHEDPNVDAYNQSTLIERAVERYLEEVGSDA